MKARNCPFCFTEADLITEPSVAVASPHSVGQRLLEADGEVMLCAGLGAIVEPYVIAFSRSHRRSICELSRLERVWLIERLDRCLASGLFRSGALRVFEHGGAVPKASVACLEHFHLHVIDGQHDLEKSLIRDFAPTEMVEVSEDRCFAADGEYLFTGTMIGDHVIRGQLARRVDCGGQYFRRVLCESAGGISWDWKVAPRYEAALGLCDRWFAQFQGQPAPVNT